jgi:hypothetical protein
MRTRTILEAVLAVVTATVGVTTALVPTWFEALFGASPDQGSGSFEVVVAVAMIVAALVLSFLSGRSTRFVSDPV